jgi:hypothetical protein
MGYTYECVCFITVAMVMLVRDFGPYKYYSDNIYHYVCLLLSFGLLILY